MQKLNRYRLVALDTNIFIYYLDKTSQHHTLAEQIIRKIASGKLRAVTSTLTLTELLSFNASEEGIKKLEREFSDIPNVNIQEVNLETAKIAARVRREYGIKLVDSIQLATALFSKSQTFITNDQRLKSFKELKITLLSEIKS